MHPILLEFGPVKIFTYGLLLATGFFSAIWLGARQGEREGYDPQTIMDLCFYILLAAILGARILYVIVEYKYFASRPLDILMVWKGGLVFYGGLILSVIVAMGFIKKRQLSLWRIADILAPSIAIGQAIGRWGCFFAGCCYGRPTDFSWGVTFTDSRALAPLNHSLHPTQVYLSLNALAIFWILIWLRKRKAFDGQIFCAYGILYSIGRFLIEFLRGDDRGFAIEKILSTSQFIGIFLLIASLLIWRRLSLTKSIV
tara:strand:+ start:3612 stop:4379 length:768 start_codon:yes stop_codon:yes gene_type:complete